MRLTVLQFYISRWAKRKAGTSCLLAALSFFYAGASAQGFSFISPSSNAPAQAAASDTVVVMPFENRSQMSKYNWIRESFAILLGDVLDVPGISVLNIDERNLAFERMN